MDDSIWFDYMAYNVYESDGEKGINVPFHSGSKDYMARELVDRYFPDTYDVVTWRFPEAGTEMDLLVNVTVVHLVDISYPYENITFRFAFGSPKWNASEWRTNTSYNSRGEPLEAFFKVDANGVGTTRIMLPDDYGYWIFSIQVHNISGYSHALPDTVSTRWIEARPPEGHFNHLLYQSETVDNITSLTYYDFMIAKVLTNNSFDNWFAEHFFEYDRGRRGDDIVRDAFVSFYASSLVYPPNPFEEMRFNTRAVYNISILVGHGGGEVATSEEGLQYSWEFRPDVNGEVNVVLTAPHRFSYYQFKIVCSYDDTRGARYLGEERYWNFSVIPPTEIVFESLNMTPVTPEPDAEVTVNGRLVNEFNGMGIPRAEIRIFGLSERTVYALTNLEGYFSVNSSAPSLVADSHLLTVTAKDVRSDETTEAEMLFTVEPDRSDEPDGVEFDFGFWPTLISTLFIIFITMLGLLVRQRLKRRRRQNRDRSQVP